METACSLGAFPLPEDEAIPDRRCRLTAQRVSAEHKGTGLGLATVVYGIVNQHGGAIRVDTEVDRGTVFTIYLPRVEAASGDASAGISEVRCAEGTETILLAEDDVELRTLLARVLREYGYRVLEAASGAEALRTLQNRNGAPVHLLVTDIVMPGISGYELLDMISRLYPDIRTLFMTGYTEQMRSLPRDVPLLQKPFNPHALACRVRETLDRARPVQRVSA